MPEIVGFPVDVEAADEDALKRARQQLAGGRRYRDAKREEVWRQVEAQYGGQHFTQIDVDDPTANLVVINMSFSTHNTILPFVTGEEPKFLVEPYSLDATVSNARLQQAYLNRTWRASKTGALIASKLATSDSLIYGDGWMKVSYEMRQKRVGVDATKTVADVFVDHVSPWDIWLDPNSDGFHNARWICHRMFVTKRELLADAEGEDALYKKSDIEQISFGTIDIDEQNDSEQKNRDSDTVNVDEEEWAVIFEFYDMVDDVMLTFANTGDLPLRKVEEVVPPFAPVSNHRIPRSPYHMGDLEQIWPMQEELNLARSELATHRRRNIAKYLIRVDAVSEEGKAAITSGIINEFVPIVGDAPLDTLVKPVQLQPLSAETYASADNAIRDIFEVTGVNEYQRGSAPEIRRTATEASIIEGASNIKTRAKLAMVEVAVRQVGVLLLGVAKEVFPETDVDEMGLFLTGEDAKQINQALAGEQAADAIDQADPVAANDAVDQLDTDADIDFVPTPAIFKGEYEVLVETNSTELRNPVFREQKFREMLELLTSLAPALQQLGAPINIRPVLEKWLEAAGFTDIEGVLGGQPLQPDPNAQFDAQNAQAEQALALLGQGEGANLGAAVPPLAAQTPGNTGTLPPS